MNIQRLDLLAFGPFDRHSLVFETPQPGLHLIYGHNEAGKSSCRRAIGQWLFGIPHISNDNFRHESAKLRIGGLLRNEQGQVLEFLRKKGRKDTLRTYDDQVALPEETLRPFLAGLDLHTFNQRFSLDHQELVRGGQALGAGSEIGEVLFAAGAGIADIRSIQTNLQERCRELFLPTGAKPKLNALAQQLADLKTHQRALMLSASRWAETEQQLRQAQDRNLACDTEIRHYRRELERWERWQRAIPKVAQWRASQSILATLDHAPRLSPDFPERRVQATTHLASTLQAIQTVEQRVANLSHKLESLSIPTDLLEMKTVISSWHAKLGSIQKATQDRARLVAELRVAEEQWTECQHEWRDFGSDEKLLNARFGPRVRAELQELAGQHASLTERCSLGETNVKRLERELGLLTENQNPSIKNTPINASQLEQWLAELRPLLKSADLERQAAVEAQRLAENQLKLTDLLRSLPLGPPSIEAMVALPVPLAETVERHSHELDRIEQAAALAQAALDRIKRQQRELDRELNVLRRTDQVPTEAELQATRDQRNQLWDVMTAQLSRLLHRVTSDDEREDSKVADADERPSLDTKTVDQFWNLTLAADTMADRLRREANRVAHLAQLLADQELANREHAEWEAKLASTAEARQDWQSGWRMLWHPCGFEPLSPREMLSWLRKHHELLEQVRADRQLRTSSESLNHQIEFAQQAAAALLQRMGPTEPRSNEALVDLLPRCEQRLDALRLQLTQLEQHQQRRLDLLASLQAAREQWQTAREAMLEWQQRWTDALHTAELNPRLVPRELTALLTTYDRCQTVSKDLAKLRQRIAGIDRDQLAFEVEIDKWRHLDNRTTGLRADEAAALLYDELTRAEQERTRAEQWQIQLDEQQEELQQHRRAQRDLEHELRQLCQLANCATLDELVAIEKDGLARLECERESAELQRQLFELSETSDLADFILQVEQTDASDIAWQISDTQAKLGEIETQRDQNSERVGRLKLELESMDGNAAAAQAQEDIVESVATMQHHAQQYISLRLAAAILGRVMDQYRQANQSGVLARVSQLFSELTLDSFSGVQVELQENGNLEVMGVRAKGQALVPTSGMSEGTCDQLYLAFRVALLETYLERNAPVPLLVDDLLITFDDRRSVAALRVLAHLSQRTQVIFFTHHQRLIELARQHLSSAAFSVQELDSPQLP